MQTMVMLSWIAFCIGFVSMHIYTQRAILSLKTHRIDSFKLYGTSFTMRLIRYCVYSTYIVPNFGYLMIFVLFLFLCTECENPGPSNMSVVDSQEISSLDVTDELVPSLQVNIDIRIYTG